MQLRSLIKRSASEVGDDSPARTPKLARPAKVRTESGEVRRRIGPPRRPVFVVYMAFLVVVVAIEGLAVRGQIDFAQHVLGLEGIWVAAAPLALEGGTLVWASLTLWALLTRDSTAMARMMTAFWVCAAAGANYLGAEALNRQTAAAVYLAGASIGALVTWHGILTRIRRDDLRRLQPEPREWHPARWVLAPVTTFKAWRLGILEGISPVDALRTMRSELIPVSPAPMGFEDVDVAALSKRDAVRHAAKLLGTYDAQVVRAWLMDQHGIKTDRSDANTVLRDLKAVRQRELAHVIRSTAGGEQ